MFEQEGNLKKFLIDENYIESIFISKSKIYIKSIEHFDIKKKYFHYNFTDFNWKISSETKTINGYTCYKSITYLRNLGVIADNYVAWFCPEINLQFDPNRFAGLPGLIFEVYNTNAMVKVCTGH